MRRQWAWAVVALVAARAWAGAPADVDVLAKALAKPVAIIQGKVPAFTATLGLRVREGDSDQTIELTLARLDAQQFALSV